MSQGISFTDIKEILINIADKIMREKEYLTRLDAACGDGDLGVVMYIGFRKTKEKIEKDESNDVGSLLMAVGSAILSSVGGASGPLFGTIFLEAGKTVKGKNELTLNDIASMFEASLSKAKSLGGAKVGDKTLIDAFEPAVKSLREAISEGFRLEDALDKAAEEAEHGTDSTKDLVARHGKARYLGEKSIGYIDPGAKIVRFIFETLASTYRSIASRGT